MFTVATMVGLGGFSFWYLDRALASSRRRTMEAREDRLVEFVNAWPNSGSPVPLVRKLQQLTLAIASTDIIQIYDLNGRIVYSSPGPSDLKVPWPNQDCTERCYGLVRQNAHRIRTINHVITLDGQRYRLSLSGKIDEHFDVLNAIRNSYFLVCPLMLLLSVGGGFIVSGRALEPISRINVEAQKIGIQELQRRIPVPETGDELQTLTVTWNQLLERLEIAVERLTQFTSDISHDLSTTITVMMTTAGLALSRDRSPEEYRIALQNINVECEATAELLDTLLAIARADLVHQKIEWKAINLTDLVIEVSQQFQPRAIVKGQTITLQVEDEIWTNGDLSLLRRMTSILLDNAIKYTPESGIVTVSLARRQNSLELRVSDTGIGIPEHAIPRIFDRFYRVEESRTENEESNGLGLAIAKWVVEAHRSTIDVVSKPGQGSTFTVSIPQVAQTEHTDAAYAPLS
ncbi:sensor histidine kinase [Acidicapsa acidisoli]|uniref:sensor histidine kinase n=1 Tax=Acidicapsa acidisoli TaxID=1615681 RepID=UPI0021E0389A|nr:ATP-binding protein [Acidicapsa acidisoli]